MSEIINKFLSMNNVLELVDELKKNNSNEEILTNYYNQLQISGDKEVEAYYNNKAICFVVNDNNVRRVFFFAESYNELDKLFPCIGAGAICEIVTRTSETEHNFSNLQNAVMIDTFSHYRVPLKRDEYTKNLPDEFYSSYQPDCFELAKETDVTEISDKLNMVFDKRVAHIPKKKLIQDLISEDCVYICRMENEIKTCQIFQKQGKRIYFYQLFSFLPGKFVQSLWYECLKKFENNGFILAHSWVSDKNMLSKKLHKKFNFTFDQMQCFVFETK